MSLVSAEARKRPCPKCRAEAGDPCVGKYRVRIAHHRERMRGLNKAAAKQASTRSTRGNDLGFVYFIGVGDPIERIKIGFTLGNPRRRMRELQTGSAYELLLIGYVPGTYRDEQSFHEMLHEHHASGEWFHYREAVRSFVETALGDATA